MTPARDDERRRLYDQGLSDAAIAEQTGTHKSAVQGWRKRRGLAPNFARGGSGRPLGRREHDRRMQLYRLGWSDPRIAAHCDVHSTTILEWRAKYGLPARAVSLPSQKGAVLLSHEDEERRLTLYRRGLTVAAMAKKLGLTPSQVWRWHARRQLPINKPQREWERGAVQFVSLDADRGGGDINLHGLIADDAAALWLEEQGATVS